MSVWAPDVWVAGAWADYVWSGMGEGGEEEPAPPSTITITPGMYGRRPWQRLYARTHIEHIATGGICFGGSAAVEVLLVLREPAAQEEQVIGPPPPAPLILPEPDYAAGERALVIAREHTKQRRLRAKRADAALLGLAA